MFVVHFYREQGDFGMHAFRVRWDPLKRDLRSLAWLAALVLAVLAVFYEATAAGWPLRLAAAGLFAVGTVLPGLLRWPYRLLLAACYPVIWILQRTLPTPVNPAAWPSRPARSRARRSVRPA
ncbi:MAG TPA: hypothetical protein VGY58_15460 [Gemmataceae bacterium]|jgi:hypothetical protein|nr:hypothetical protein [Gemmataceae bacterium]